MEEQGRITRLEEPVQVRLIIVFEKYLIFFHVTFNSLVLQSLPFCYCDYIHNTTTTFCIVDDEVLIVIFYQ